MASLIRDANGCKRIQIVTDDGRATIRLGQNAGQGSRDDQAAYPLHVVCEWIGNSRLVASKHYLTTTPDDWERATGGANCGALEDQKAAHKAAQHVPAPSRKGSPVRPQPVGASEVR